MPKSEGYEYGESDGFLKYFELCHRHDGEADSVRRNLQQVLKERDAPAHQCGDEPRLVAKLFQMGVSGKRHEYVAERH
jgi:hypothetical protein